MPNPDLTPTPEQAAIIQSVASGDDTMVNALAGCAKTTSIELSIRQSDPEPTLVLAFNVKIKKELETRLKDLPHVKVQTANGLGHAVAMRGGLRPTIDKDKTFKLAKETGLRGEDLTALLQLSRSARLAGLVPSSLAGTGLVPDNPDTWAGLCEELFVDPVLIPAARKLLEKSHLLSLSGTIDFDDQLYLSTCVFRNYPKYNRIFVDEAQDLSPMNHEQVRLAASRYGQIVAVGDPFQAIYAFRGASHDSMDRLRRLRNVWTTLPLSMTFRCPKRVVSRQHHLVPHFTAAPEAPEGTIETRSSWVPSRGDAVLCRNNAPLYSTAFKLLRAGLPVHMLGTDIGRALKRVYNKLSDHGAVQRPVVIDRIDQEIAKDPKKADRLESLRAILLAEPDLDKALAILSAAPADGVVLATGHRAKGLEWPTVWFLDPQLIPSQYADTDAELAQEANLRYVIETRTKDSLFFVRRDGLFLKG
jgi:DNA helicase-2/ATP-dependent DNA helicase PcrA